MSGVDQADQLRSYYDTQRVSHEGLKDALTFSLGYYCG